MAASAPRVTYLVCATHRTGSNLLCQLLWHTGRAGFPQEFFSTTRMGPIAAEHVPEVDPKQDFRRYLEALRVRRQTPNGVFGAKIMWSHLDWVGSELGRPGASPWETLAVLLPGARCIWMRRRDKARQAISMVKAKQTGIFNSLQLAEGGPARQPLAYDFKAIDKHARRFEQEDRAWGALFEGAGIEPATVVYEELVADVDPVLRDVLRFLGEEVAEDFRAPGTHYRKLTDATNDDWWERYRRERGVARG